MTDIRARTVRDFCRAYGVGKTLAFELFQSGAVQVVRIGKRKTLVDEASALAWYEGKKSLPTSLPTSRGRIEANQSEPQRRKARAAR